MLSTQSSIQGKGNESSTATAFNSTKSVQNCEEPSDFGANKQEELLTLYCRSGLNQIRCSLLHYFLPHCLMLLQTLRPSSSTVQPNETQGTDAAAILCSEQSPDNPPGVKKQYTLKSTGTGSQPQSMEVEQVAPAPLPQFSYISFQTQAKNNVSGSGHSLW